MFKFLLIALLALTLVVGCRVPDSNAKDPFAEMNKVQTFKMYLPDGTTELVKSVACRVAVSGTVQLSNVFVVECYTQGKNVWSGVVTKMVLQDE